MHPAYVDLKRLLLVGPTADMYVRKPLHPSLFNASKGWAVSAGG